MCRQDLGNDGVAVRWRTTFAAIAALFPIFLGLTVPPALGDTGAPAAPPPCALTLSGTGQPVGFDQFRGQVLYVDFWASWCGPCLLSFPFMNEMQRTYGDKGLHVLAINMDEKPADAARFLGQHPATFDVAQGPNGKCAKDFGVATMPTSFLVDRGGMIRAVHKGFRPGDIDELKAKLEELIAEKATGPEGK
jgi:thiol-disulfide isomerase/thioredoxin